MVAGRKENPFAQGLKRTRRHAGKPHTSVCERNLRASGVERGYANLYGGVLQYSTTFATPAILAPSADDCRPIQSRFLLHFSNRKNQRQRKARCEPSLDQNTAVLRTYNSIES